MSEDNLFNQLAQKLDLCEPEQTSAEAWLEKNKAVVVVIAMMAMSLLLYNTYCYFSNRDQNKLDDGKKNKKNMNQKEE